MAPNLSILSIPVYYLVTLIPHLRALSLLRSSTTIKFNNKAPKSASFASTLQKGIPAEIYARYERLEAAHHNGMENLPLFMGAVILGNFAHLGAGKLNGFVGTYLLARVVYNALYEGAKTNRTSYWRTMVWFSSTVYALGVIIAAGWVSL